MFEIMTSQAAVVNRARDMWYEHGHDDSEPMPRVVIPAVLRYPCLSICIVSNGSYLPASKTLQPECFTLVFCGRKDTKRLIYPNTNKNRYAIGAGPYVFVNNREDIIAYMKVTSKGLVGAPIGKSEEQDMVSRKFAGYLDSLDVSEFPCLIKHKAYYIKTSRVLDFFVVCKSMAKHLVYWKKDMRAPERARVYTPKFGNVAYKHVISIGSAQDDTPSVTIDVSLAKGQVMRFRQDIEEEVRDRERERIGIHNTRLIQNIDRDRRRRPVSSDHLQALAKKEIASFEEWRKMYRNLLLDKYPNEALGVGLGAAPGADEPPAVLKTSKALRRVD